MYMYLAVHVQCKINTAIAWGRTRRGRSDSGASSQGQPIYNTTAKSKLPRKAKKKVYLKKNVLLLLLIIMMMKIIKMVVAG